MTNLILVAISAGIPTESCEDRYSLRHGFANANPTFEIRTELTCQNRDPEFFPDPVDVNLYRKAKNLPRTSHTAIQTGCPLRPIGNSHPTIGVQRC